MFYQLNSGEKCKASPCHLYTLGFCTHDMTSDTQGLNEWFLCLQLRGNLIPDFSPQDELEISRQSTLPSLYSPQIFLNLQINWLQPQSWKEPPNTIIVIYYVIISLTTFSGCNFQEKLSSSSSTQQGGPCDQVAGRDGLFGSVLIDFCLVSWERERRAVASNVLTSSESHAELGDN